jgi:hypothetical protein
MSHTIKQKVWHWYKQRCIIIKCVHCGSENKRPADSLHFFCAECGLGN